MFEDRRCFNFVYIFLMWQLTAALFVSLNEANDGVSLKDHSDQLQHDHYTICMLDMV